MSDWLYPLPVVPMALLVFGATYLVTGAIYGVVMALAVGHRARAFTSISPGVLPPLGIIFGLLAAFLASQVWGDVEHAQTAVHREASALRTVILLAASFPGATEARLRTLIRQHIAAVVTQEWQTMVSHHVTLTLAPAALAEALQVSLALTPRGAGQVVAQRELVVALGNALDARRQRIIISQAAVNWVKWTGLLLQAICTLLAIAMVHSDNRAAAAIVLAIFATGVAVSVLLIVSHNRPFTGAIAVRPDVLLQVIPEERLPASGR